MALLRSWSPEQARLKGAIPTGTQRAGEMGPSPPSFHLHPWAHHSTSAAAGDLSSRCPSVPAHGWCAGHFSPQRKVKLVVAVRAESGDWSVSSLAGGDAPWAWLVLPVGDKGT